MVSKFFTLLFALFLILICMAGNSYSSQGKSVIKSGAYIPGDIVSIESLRFLPVPRTNSNYSIFQSIGNISNIILGRFDSVPQRITLIQDNNGDGKVDVVAHWIVADKKFEKEKKPDEICSAEKFREYKESIMGGNSSIEKFDSMKLFNYLIKDKTNIHREKYGFRVVLSDIESKKRERIIYYYSDNGINGSDLVLEVKYFKIKRSRIHPLINHYVYCKDSKDTYVRDFVNKLLSKTKKALSNK